MLGLKERVKVFTNVHGEVMTMKSDSNGNITIMHEDCNDRFESVKEFILKYVLIPEEMQQIFDFVTECKKDLETI